MLIQCPECERNVSDKAASCPDCGFPVREHVETEAKLKDQATERSSRKRENHDTDCPWCDARGFRMLEDPSDSKHKPSFEWCDQCQRSGRVCLAHSNEGYFALSVSSAQPFINGSVDASDHGVRCLGTLAPGPHRYPDAGKREPEPEMS